MVNFIANGTEFDALLERSNTKLVVVDFTATWCGPCRFIGPIFEKLATENPEAEFVKVDVDEAEDVAARCSIQAMPTFHFYKGGVKVAEMMGADQAKLVSLVAQHK
jgi:thioredoxin